MSYPISPLGMSFWLFWGVVGGCWEIGTVLTKRTKWTLSYQVWCLAFREPPAVRDVFIALCGLASTSLVIHFFGRFG